MRDDSGSRLAGKRIVVTRAAEQAGELAAKLEAAGGEVLLAPLLRFAETPNGEALEGALRSLREFDWLIFTSANAVRFVAGRMAKLDVSLTAGVNEAKTGRPQIAAVGPATANAASAAGFSVDLVAKRHSARELAGEIIAATGARIRDARVLLPRSDRADDALPSLLRKAGARVTEVEAYCTLTADDTDPNMLRMIGKGEVDMITLASPSAVLALVDLIGAERLRTICPRTALAAIGPATAAAIREQGLPEPIVAGEASADGIVDAIIGHFRAGEVHSTEPTRVEARAR